MDLRKRAEFPKGRHGSKGDGNIVLGRIFVGVTKKDLHISAESKILECLKIEPDSSGAQLQLFQCGSVENENSRKVRMGRQGGVIISQRVNGQQDAVWWTDRQWGPRA